MKKRLLLLLSVGMIVSSIRANAQTFEVQQLLLDIEKLTQLKHILQDLKDGYQILEQGYSTIRDIVHGNFDLHKAYLDGLLLVNPAVSHHPEVKAIVDMQSRIALQTKAAMGQFRRDSELTPKELDYLEKVYSNINAESDKQLDQLLLVLTDSKLRMSDEERIHAITHVYTDVQNQYQFLRQFNTGTLLLVQQRVTDTEDAGTLRNLFER